MDFKELLNTEEAEYKESPQKIHESLVDYIASFEPANEAD